MKTVNINQDILDGIQMVGEDHTNGLVVVRTSKTRIDVSDGVGQLTLEKVGMGNMWNATVTGDASIILATLADFPGLVVD